MEYIDNIPIYSFGHFFDHDRLAVQLFVLLETDERAHTARRLDFGQLDLVDRLGTGGGLSNPPQEVIYP